MSEEHDIMEDVLGTGGFTPPTQDAHGKPSTSSILMGGAVDMAKDYVVSTVSDKIGAEAKAIEEKGIFGRGLEIAADGLRNGFDGLVAGGAGVLGVASDLVRLPTEGAYSLLTGQSYDPFLITKGLHETVSGQGEGATARIVGAANAAKEYVANGFDSEAAAAGFEDGKNAVVDFGNEAEKGIVGSAVAYGAYGIGMLAAPGAIFGKAGKVAEATGVGAQGAEGATATATTAARVLTAGEEVGTSAAARTAAVVAEETAEVGAGAVSKAAALTGETAAESTGLLGRGTNWLKGLARGGETTHHVMDAAGDAVNFTGDMLRMGNTAMLMMGALTMVMEMFGMDPKNVKEMVTGMGKHFLPESMQGVSDEAMGAMFDVSKERYGSMDKLMKGAMGDEGTDVASVLGMGEPEAGKSGGLLDMFAPKQGAAPVAKPS